MCMCLGGTPPVRSDILLPHRGVEVNCPINNRIFVLNRFEELIGFLSQSKLSR